MITVYRMLTVVGNVHVESLVAQKKNTSDVLVDLLQTNKGFHQLKNGFNASDLSKAIEKYLEKLPNNTRPTWQVRFHHYYFRMEVSVRVCPK
jgi:hypothetical protein